MTQRTKSARISVGSLDQLAEAGHRIEERTQRLLSLLLFHKIHQGPRGLSGLVGGDFRPYQLARELEDTGVGFDLTDHRNDFSGPAAADDRPRAKDEILPVRDRLLYRLE